MKLIESGTMIKKRIVLVGLAFLLLIGAMLFYTLSMNY